MRDSISLLTLAFFAPVAAGAVGCVSNEYVIPHEELVRLASMPPEMRGARIHAVQSIGERRAWAVPPETEDGAPVDEGSDQAGTGLEDDASDSAEPSIDLRIEGGPHERRVAPGERVGPGPGVRRGARRGSDGGWVGPSSPARPTSGRAPVARGAPSAGIDRGAHGGGVPARGSAGPSGFHLTSGGGGGGGGGDGGEALVVLAVLLVVVAALAMVGLAGSEGVRFDGYVEMSPDQPVHLESSSGAHATVPLGDLTLQQVIGSVEAKVMDDERPGLRLVEQVLDRRGLAFKLDFGTVAFERESSTETFSGLASHIQVGYFFTRRLGLLATAGLGRADDGIGATLSRHQFGLELQALPFAVGRLHLGAYANGGLAVIGSTAGAGSVATGKGAGGGALLELDVTGRMALTLRAGADLARFDGGWSPAATVAAGLAVY